MKNKTFWTELTWSIMKKAVIVMCRVVCALCKPIKINNVCHIMHCESESQHTKHGICTDISTIFEISISWNWEVHYFWPWANCHLSSTVIDKDSLFGYAVYPVPDAHGWFSRWNKLAPFINCLGNTWNGYRSAVQTVSRVHPLTKCLQIRRNVFKSRLALLLADGHLCCNIVNYKPEGCVMVVVVVVCWSCRVIVIIVSTASVRTMQLTFYFIMLLLTIITKIYQSFFST